MSGVQRIVLAESKGLKVPTNEDLRNEGVAGPEKTPEESKEEEK